MKRKTAFFNIIIKMKSAAPSWVTATGFLRPRACRLSSSSSRRPSRHMHFRSTSHHRPTVVSVAMPRKSSRRFYCDHCAKSYSIKYDLQRHIRIEHEHRKDFHCARCLRTFTRSSSMLRHVRANVCKDENIPAQALLDLSTVESDPVVLAAAEVLIHMKSDGDSVCKFRKKVVFAF